MYAETDFLSSSRFQRFASKYGRLKCDWIYRSFNMMADSTSHTHACGQIFLDWKFIKKYNCTVVCRRSRMCAPISIHQNWNVNKGPIMNSDLFVLGAPSPRFLAPHIMQYHNAFRLCHIFDWNAKMFPFTILMAVVAVKHSIILIFCRMLFSTE